VCIEGRVVGRTPWEWSARPGTYHLTLRKAGHEDTPLTVQLGAGGRERVRPVMHYPRGVLDQVTEPAGARCEVRSAGRTILATTTPCHVELPEGTYDVALSHPLCLPAPVRRVQIRANHLVTREQVRLTKSTGLLVLRSSLDGVEVALRREGSDRVETAIRLPRREPLELAAGRWMLEAGRLGHWSTIRSFEVTAGMTTELTAWCPAVVANMKHGLSKPGDPASPGIPYHVSAGRRGGDAMFLVVVDRETDPGVGLGPITHRDELGGFSGHVSTACAVPPGASIVHLAQADLDGDGAADPIVAATGASNPPCDSILAAFSRASGRCLWTWNDRVLFDTRPVVAGDVDGDGRADMAIGLMSLDGTRSQLAMVSGATGTRLWTVLAPPGDKELLAEDVDGDGTTDIVIRLPDERQLARSGRDGRSIRLVDPRPARGDLDGDGDLDDVVVLPGGRVRATTSRDGRVLWEVAVAAMERGDGPVRPAALDLDGDRACEVILLGRGGLASLEGRTGRVLAVRPLHQGDARSLADLAVLACDIDRDGRAELVVQETDRVSIWRDPHLTPVLSVATPPPQPRQAGRLTRLDVADVDGDGTPELVAIPSPRTLALYDLRRPDGIIWGWRVDGKIVGRPRAADLDRDGYADVLVPGRDATGRDSLEAVSGKTGALLWRANMSSRTVTVVETASPGKRPLVVDTSTHERPLTREVQLLDGATGRRLRMLPGRWIDVDTVADLDGDGVLDVAGISRLDGEAKESTFAMISGRTGATRWSLALRGRPDRLQDDRDLDGAGWPDLLLRIEAGPEAGAKAFVLMAIAGATGRILWERPLPRHGHVQLFMPESDGAAALIQRCRQKEARASGRYELQVTGAADGRPRFSVQPEPEGEGRGIACATADLDGKPGEEVAVLEDDRSLSARSGRDGRLLWMTMMKDTGCDEPYTCRLDGDALPDVAVLTYEGRLVGFSGLTGKQLFDGEALAKDKVAVDDEDLDQAERAIPWNVYRPLLIDRPLTGGSARVVYLIGPRTILTRQLPEGSR
jgi:hypothetical protein